MLVDKRLSPLVDEPSERTQLSFSVVVVVMVGRFPFQNLVKAKLRIERVGCIATLTNPRLQTIVPSTFRTLGPLPRCKAEHFPSLS